MPDDTIVQSRAAWSHLVAITRDEVTGTLRLALYSAKVWHSKAPFRGIQNRIGSLSQGVMVEADNSRYLPHSVLVLPQLNELGLADTIGSFVSGMVETVDADLDRTIVRDWIHLEGSGDEFPGDFAADVIFDGLNQRLASPAQTGFIVIELDVLIYQ
jgi:hypothetical protein